MNTKQILQIEFYVKILVQSLELWSVISLAIGHCIKVGFFFFKPWVWELLSLSQWSESVVLRHFTCLEYDCMVLHLTEIYIITHCQDITKIVFKEM